MRTHAVFLRLDGRRCVVVGGDALAEAKALECLAAGARVTVVAPEVTPALAERHAAGVLDWQARAYRSGDLAGAMLAYAVTRAPDLIARLRADAERERVLLNVVDVPDACSFYAGAIVDRGDLRIAIGTGGASPGLAARLRRELEVQVGPEYAPFVAILGAVRRHLEGHPARMTVMASLLDSPLLDLVRRDDRPGIDRLLSEVAGAACTLDRLDLEAGD
ncbi:MAG TPA: bifunctional precorrin-2 dehydrogenase/sirohydrochlorin ferrochelatase [Candidatus Binatia bacterium]|jgi:siroheme synthase-like protein|nr:bifunctional precorrin-2 dehydrogenase/sirohydrochlorin ferrochelatase [Candidatus Binatia bacterium]